MNDQHVLDLVHAIHRTTLDPGLWPETLDGLADAFGMAFGMFNVERLTENSGQLKGTPRANGSFLEQYSAHYGAINPWRATFSTLSPGRHTLQRRKRIIPRAEFQRTEFFNDFLLPNDVRYVIGTTVAVADGRLIGINLCGPREFEDYTEEDRRLQEALVPHLQIAVQAQIRLGYFHHASLHLTSALDRHPLGIILLDRHERVSFTNERARAITAAHDGLTIEDGRLVATNPHANTLLQQALQAALAPARDTLADPAEGVCIPRPSGRWAYEVLAMPNREPEHQLLPQPGAIAFIADPADNSHDMRPCLHSLYGLTAAEANLVQALVDGLTLREAADELGRSIETMRYHLKGVFEKTGTRRQVDLIRLILSGPANLASISIRRPDAAE